VSSFYGIAWMADICLFVSIYRVAFLGHQNGWDAGGGTVLGLGGLSLEILL
jgi:hypothetical protein